MVAECVFFRRDTAYRILADHIRTLSFAIADGAYPSNEGRGYVIRRILRRAIKYSNHTLTDAPNDGMPTTACFWQLVSNLVLHMGDAYPELQTNEMKIVQLLAEEEESFASMLGRGIRHIDDLTTATHDTPHKDGSLIHQKIITGDAAFFLYSSLGLPLDLTQLIAADRGWSVDTEGFHAAMEQERERGRANQRKVLDKSHLPVLTLRANDISALRASNILPTDDTDKYLSHVPTEQAVTIRAAFTSSGSANGGVQSIDTIDQTTAGCIGLVLDKTPFYSESGGQVSDTGTIRLKDAQSGKVWDLEVYSVHVYGGYVLHCCAVPDSMAPVSLINKVVDCHVDYERRKKVAINHTVTHILNFFLRKLLGDSVRQRGSLVSDDKFRFDFSFNKNLSSEQLRQLEDSVNAVIK
jgi:alanyl-tRNA synthetase